MKGEVKLPATKWYLTIPIQIREQFLDNDPEEAECQLIGNSLQIVIDEGDGDMVIRAELNSWETGKPRVRKLNNGSGVYMGDWKEDLKVIEDDDDRYVPATVSRKDGTVTPQKTEQQDGKITYYQAEQMVERYIRKNRDRRTRLRSTDVANTMDVERNQHNLMRICNALEKRCQVVSSGSSKAKQFSMPSDD